MVLPNQFNKRTDFWIIIITWLWLFSNLILSFFDIFEKTLFGFAGIKSIDLFFLAVILIMTMFNVQFWVNRKIGSWYYLTCCTPLLFHFFNVLLNKSSCFRTVKLHVVLLIVILFHLTTLTDLILYYLNLLYYYQIGQNVFFCIYYHHLLDPM